MSERVLVDIWTVETASGSRTAEISIDAVFTLLVSEVVNHDGISNLQSCRSLRGRSRNTAPSAGPAEPPATNEPWHGLT